MWYFFLLVPSALVENEVDAVVSDVENKREGDYKDTVRRILSQHPPVLSFYSWVPETGRDHARGPAIEGAALNSSTRPVK
jgi:hypothetical protein